AKRRLQLRRRFPSLGATLPTVAAVVAAITAAPATISGAVNQAAAVAPIAPATIAQATVAQAAVAIAIARADVFRHGLRRDGSRHLINRPLIDRIGRLDRRIDGHRPVDRHGRIVGLIAVAASAAAAAGGGGAHGKNQGRQRRGTGNDTHTNRHQRRSLFICFHAEALDDWGRGPRFIPALLPATRTLRAFCAWVPAAPRRRAAARTAGVWGVAPGWRPPSRAL